MNELAELAALRRAAAEVLALHRRSALPIWKGRDTGKHYCLACTTSVDDYTVYVPWPCPTAQAFPAVLVYQEVGDAAPQAPDAG